ncbi:hypothetical protein ASD58_06440 [Duganella sp. Root1480D1]|nr:hypothetical protein ASD07_08960 [Duganella sp. Root336D2]KQZ40015.1 hypothetical protein ASD58_06440 [Duganella sp. Root1480D1]KRC00617.1 hypothetical protein ASE26_23160 [Duganella sp. Root198D2]
MTMDTSDQTKLLAKALYEIRLLLSGYLGSSVDADMSVRIAAHIAYALHNEALAVCDGDTFDLAGATKKIEAIDRLLDQRVSERLL